MDSDELESMLAIKVKSSRVILYVLPPGSSS